MRASLASQAATNGGQHDKRDQRDGAGAIDDPPAWRAEDDHLTGWGGDPALVKAPARAFRWKRLLEHGRHGSISELAAAENLDQGYLGLILALTLLAPEIVEAILDGRQPPAMTLPVLMGPFPMEWAEQQVRLCGHA